jgi:hypothetical protein
MCAAVEDEDEQKKKQNKGAIVSVSSEVYHERQRLQLCGVHCVNNVLQRRAYTQASFDVLCEELSPSKGWMQINPHRSALGLGDYLVATNARPARPGESAELTAWGKSVAWVGLAVEAVHSGEATDDAGVVQFSARFLEAGALVTLAER